MLYREAGQFKTTYAEDQQIFPIRQDRIAVARAARVRLRRGAADRQPVLAVGDPDAVPDLRAGRARPQHPHRLRRPALARHGGVHGGGRVHGLQLRAAHALACRSSCRFVLGRAVRGRGRHRVRPAVSLRIKGFYLAVATLACQFFVLWALQRIGWFSNHSASGVITAQKIEILGYAFDTPADKYLLTLGDRRGAGAAGQEPDAQRDRPRLHGGARHGRRRRGDRHPHDADQAARLRDQLVLLRRRRRALRVRLPRHGRAGGASTSTCRSGSCSW